MQTLFTLNTLIDDILLTIRNNNISESEDLSRMQIEQWIHYYRAMLIKQDLDKGRSPNPSYFQGLYNLTLTEIPADPTVSCTGCSVNMDTVLKTTDKIPSPIDLHFGTGILYVTDAGNNPIQYMPKVRRSFQFERKYTKYDPTYYYENHYIYIHSILQMETINVIGIWENPMELGLNADEQYPIPVNMLPVLKQLIIERELGVMLNTKSDDKNNSTLEDIKPNANQ